MDIDKATKAQACAHTIFGAESVIGRGNLPPREGRQLYFARVDPHLTAGCDLCLDTSPSFLKPLEDIQLNFIRRLLHVNPRSIIAPLFTETGIMPVRHQSVILALRYLAYLLDLSPIHYSRMARHDNCSIKVTPVGSWTLLGFCSISRLCHSFSSSHLGIGSAD
jgi:hypothetical protein